MPMTAEKFEPRSDAIRVRNNLDAIEMALADGASRHDVYEWMRTKTGLTMTYKAFVTALQRQRLKRKESQLETLTTAPTVVPVTVPTAVQATQAQFNKPSVDVAAALLDMKINGLPKSEVEENSSIYISKTAAKRYMERPKPSDNPEY